MAYWICGWPGPGWKVPGWKANWSGCWTMPGWTATWKVWPAAYGAPGGQERMVGGAGPGPGADTVWLTLTGTGRLELEIVTGWDFILGE